jgi:hypothetical protein
MAIEDPEDIRDMLQRQADQRINPFMKGLSMLTGGIAGEFTGTNEQIRSRNKAKESLLYQQQRDLENERMNSRMDARREAEIKREIERARPEIAGSLRALGYNLGDPDIETLREMSSFEKSKQQKLKEDEIIETRRSQMIGKLRARPDYQLGGSMAMPVPALETTQSLEEQSSYEEQKQKQKQDDENRELKSGYINLGGIGGTPDQLKGISEKFPEYKALIDNALKKALTDEPKVVSTQDPVTKAWIKRIEWPRTYTPAMIKEYLKLNSEEEEYADEPAKDTVKGTKATKPTSFDGYRVTIAEEEKRK